MSFLLLILKKFYPYLIAVAVVIGAYHWIKHRGYSECQQKHLLQEAVEIITRIDTAQKGEKKADEVINAHRERTKVPDPSKPVFNLDAYRACLLTSKTPLRPGECD